MRYYAYKRVSTQSQAEHNGISMQTDVINGFCEKNGISVSDEFVDFGISGTIVDRDGITELLAMLQEGDKIIVQNTSRLWRSDFAKVMIKHEIEKAGADILSIEQPNYSVYTKDPNDFLVNSMLELLDQHEKMTIALKLSKGRKARAKAGSKPCGTAPYGYKWEENNIVIDYNNNLVVADIFRQYKALGSLEKVRLYCIEKGYKSATGKDFSKQSLANIINNDFYIGIVTYAGKKSQGTHEPIIEESLFYSIHKNLEENC